MIYAVIETPNGKLGISLIRICPTENLPTTTTNKAATAAIKFPILCGTNATKYYSQQTSSWKRVNERQKKVQKKPTCFLNANKQKKNSDLLLVIISTFEFQRKKTMPLRLFEFH